MERVEYSKKVKQHFLHPKFMGEIKKADSIGEYKNPTCGDTMKVYLKIAKNKKGEEIIKDIKFQTLGCAAAIASSDVACEIVKGKTIKEALKITGKDVSKKLGGLPPIKEHCSLLGQDAIRMAIEDYMKNK